MGFASAHVERAVACSRMVGAWSLILGVGVMIWGLVCFPWIEPIRTHADYKYIAVEPVSVQPDDAIHPGGSRPFAAGPFPEGPSQQYVDTHESRSGKSETSGASVAYVIPGLVLLLLARYAARVDLWAYIALACISGSFAVVYLLDLVSLLGVEFPFHQEPILTETLLRPLGIYLFALCLNAQRDALDEYRKRRRSHRATAQRSLTGAEVISVKLQPARLPPRPVLGSPRE